MTGAAIVGIILGVVVVVIAPTLIWLGLRRSGPHERTPTTAEHHELRAAAAGEATGVTPTTGGDVVDMLLAQHREIRTLLARVRESQGTQRRLAFDELRETLARHETAEEMVVRRLTRSAPDGAPVAERRTEEEDTGKRALAELEQMDVASGEFATAFEDFRLNILAHADAEEHEELPLLRASVGAEQLGLAKRHLERAEAVAPTHPHPAMKSTAMNHVAGPFAAMTDRARDALSKATH